MLLQTSHILSFQAKGVAISSELTLQSCVGMFVLSTCLWSD